MSAEEAKTYGMLDAVLVKREEAATPAGAL
jgi:ATP-dependent protease ClpP protease subunit